MSEDRQPSVSDPPRSGCLTAIMVISGIILLLPGLCSLILVSAGAITSASDIQFVVGCLMVGAVGVGLIWWAIRRRRP